MPLKVRFDKPKPDGFRGIVIHSEPHGSLRLVGVDVFLAADQKWSVGKHYDQAFADNAVKGLKGEAKLPWPRVLLKSNGDVVASTTEAIPADLPTGPYILAIEIC